MSFSQGGGGGGAGEGEAGVQQQQYQQYLQYQHQLQTMQAHHPMQQPQVDINTTNLKIVYIEDSILHFTVQSVLAYLLFILPLNSLDVGWKWKCVTST